MVGALRTSNRREFDATRRDGEPSPEETAQPWEQWQP
jgi:hypothetical protein